MNFIAAQQKNVSFPLILLVIVHYYLNTTANTTTSK
jgi:hypothetical protein